MRKEKASDAPAAGGAASSGSGGNAFTVTVGGQSYGVEFGDDGKATVNGTAYDVSVSEGLSGGGSGGAAAAPAGDTKPVQAPMPGAVFAFKKNVGEAVKEGEPIIILEAMKMEMPVNAPCDGTVAEILVAKGDQVGAGQTLATVS